MHKKILGICVALVALGAMIAPAMASASPVLTENGTAVATGVNINATLEEGTTSKLTIVKGGEAVVCTKSTLTGKLTKNSGTHIEGDITVASFKGSAAEEKCTTNFIGNTAVDVNNPSYCITAGGELAKDTFQILPHLCGGTGGTFTFTLTGALGTCKYERSTAISGTFTTGGTQATLTVTGEPEFKGEATNTFPCPAQGWLDASYVLETDVSPFTPLTIS
jgi:hypothetical protein